MTNYVDSSGRPLGFGPTEDYGKAMVAKIVSDAVLSAWASCVGSGSKMLSEILLKQSDIAEADYKIAYIKAMKSLK